MSDNYPTDEWIMKMYGSWFDPCPLNDNPIFDGLKIEWLSRTFVNPPYSNIRPWVLKAIEENQLGKTIVMLLPHNSSTKWYRWLHEAGAHFMMIQGRLRHGTGNPAPHSSILAVLA